MLTLALYIAGYVAFLVVLFYVLRGALMFAYVAVVALVKFSDWLWHLAGRAVRGARGFISW